MSSLACVYLGHRCVLTMNAPLSLVFVVVFAQFSHCLLWPDCSTFITIGDNQTICQRTPRSDVTNEWRCGDLQSALEAAEGLFVDTLFDLPEQQSTPSCISIEVPPGDHLITTPIHFNATNVYIYGTGEEANNVTISCNYTVDVNESRILDMDYNYTDYTFYFNRSEVVSFENVEFVACPYPLRLDTVGTVRVHNSIFRMFTEAVFDIFNSANVSLTNSTFANNRGTGISRYPFRANTGAVSIGYNNVPRHFQLVKAMITECKFTTNKATAFHKVRSTNAAFSRRIFSGRGGGLGIFCNEFYHDISLKFVDNRFENNYARSFGGALYFVTFGERTQNLYNLTNNFFINNSAPLGGGAISNTFFSDGIPGSPHQLLMIDCIYDGNLGQSGGALSLYLPYGAQGVSYIRCERCYFVDNHGNNTDGEYGAAVAIYRVNQFESRDSVPRYDFIDCTFENNSGNNGIFTVAHFPITFNGNTRFIGNMGTDALKIVGSLIDFCGEVLFFNNTSFRARSVAIRMQSFAQIRFNSGLEILFSENSGVYGASILVDSPTASLSFGKLAYNPQCFVIYEDKSSAPGKWNNVSVSFQRNTAVLGSSILISRLDTCSWVSTNADPSFSDVYVYDWPIWDYGNNSINTAYVDSYNAKYSFVTTSETLITNNKSVRAWPGQWFTIELTALDQFGHKTTFAARFNDVILNHPAQLAEHIYIVVSFNPYIVVNYATRNVSLTRNFKLKYHISIVEALDTDRPDNGTVKIDDPIQSVAVTPANFSLHPTLCPAGYALVSINQNIRQLECQCDVYKLIIHCESDQDTIILEEGYWGVVVLDSLHYRYDLFLHPCPPGYCKCSLNTSLGSSSCAFTYTNSDPDAQCTNNRKGILCGECRGGMGVSVLFNECASCHNAQALLILVLITADVIAFCAIIIADIPLFEWVYPYFFYIQAVATVAVYFPLSFLTSGKFLLFLNSALSFYFVYDFCLHSNMSPLVSYFIKYLPIFVFILILPTVAVFREKKKMFLKHHGVWWIIVLLYTHLVHTSMSILACPFLPDSLIPRWFFSGNIHCFTGWHIPLSLLAIAALLVAVLLIPLVSLISRRQHIIKRFYWFKYFEGPLTYPYKEEWRWWSAVELARRFVFVLFVMPFPRNSVSPMFVLCLMLVVYGIIQPYKSRATNVMELLIQINFILLLALELSGYLKDTYSIFPIPEMPAIRSNSVNTTLSDSAFNGRISSITKILLPFYYLPVLPFIITAVVKLIQYIKKWRASRTKDLLLSHSIEIIDPVKMTELKIGDCSEYAMMTDTA